MISWGQGKVCALHITMPTSESRPSNCVQWQGCRTDVGSGMGGVPSDDTTRKAEAVGWGETSWRAITLSAGGASMKALRSPAVETAPVLTRDPAHGGPTSLCLSRTGDRNSTSAIFCFCVQMRSQVEKGGLIPHPCAFFMGRFFWLCDWSNQKYRIIIIISLSILLFWNYSAPFVTGYLYYVNFLKYQKFIKGEFWCIDYIQNKMKL